MSRQLPSKLAAGLAVGGVALGGGGLAVATGLSTSGAGAQSDTTSTSTSTTKSHSPGKRGHHRPPRAIMLAEAALHPGPPADGRPPAGRPPRPPNGQRPTAADHLARRNAYFAAIAKELGKQGDDVTAAVRSAIAAELKKDVTAGKLTDAQAAKVLAAWDKGGPGHPHGPGGPDGPGGPGRPPHDGNEPPRDGDGPPRGPDGKRPSRDQIAKDVAAFQSSVADSLGVNVDELVKAIGAAAATTAPQAP